MKKRAQEFKESLPKQFKDYKPTPIYEEVIKAHYKIITMVYDSKIEIPLEKVINYARAVHSISYGSEIEYLLNEVLMLFKDNTEEELTVSEGFKESMAELEKTVAENETLSEMWAIVMALDMLDHCLDSTALIKAVVSESEEELKANFKELSGEEMTPEQVAHISKHGGLVQKRTKEPDALEDPEKVMH